MLYECSAADQAPSLTSVSLQDTSHGIRLHAILSSSLFPQDEADCLVIMHVTRCRTLTVPRSKMSCNAHAGGMHNSKHLLKQLLCTVQELLDALGVAQAGCRPGVFPEEVLHKTLHKVLRRPLRLRRLPRLHTRTHTHTHKRLHSCTQL